MPPYTLKRFKRSRSVRITVRPGGAVVVTAPLRVGRSEIDRFVESKAAWIKEASERLGPARPALGSAERAALSEKARALVSERLVHFNAFYGFRWSKIRIGNQSTRWGSCSRRGTLSFNCRLAVLPADLADYVVVHELCHLKEFNHSERFWDLVAKTVPDYQERRQALRRLGLHLG